MADFDLVLRGRRVITRAGEVPRCVAVRDGVVVAIEPLESRLERRPRPSTSPTTRCCCPASSTPTCTSTSPAAPSGRASRPPPAPPRRAASRRSSTCRSTASRRPRRSTALEVKRKAAQDSAHVDVGFWGGAIPGNIDDLRGLHDAGVFGFKCFLTALRGGRVPAAVGRRARASTWASWPASAALMIVHAEDSTAIERAPGAARAALRRLPRLPAARRRRTSRSRTSSRRPGTPARRCTCCTCPAPTPCR